MLAYNCTKSTKKLLHRRIPTDDFLARIGVQESPNCSFCNEDPENLHHLLWSCSKTKLFWDRLLLKLCSLHIGNTTLRKRPCYILRTIDRRQDVVLVLLDLSAAFDTIDHTILVKDSSLISVSQNRHCAGSDLTLKTIGNQ